MIHCDLKPDNILVGESGLPKILDFGIARLQDSVNVGKSESQAIRRHVRLRQSRATSRRNADALRPTTDVYSLGLVAHELLTGQASASPIRQTGPLTCAAFGWANRDSPLSTHDDHRFPTSVGGQYSPPLLRKTRGQPYRSAGEMGNDLQQIHDIFCEPASVPPSNHGMSSWFHRFDHPSSGPNPCEASRRSHPPAICTIFRKRIGLSGNESDFDARDDQKSRLDLTISSVLLYIHLIRMKELSDKERSGDDSARAMVTDVIFKSMTDPIRRSEFCKSFCRMNLACRNW